MRIAFDISVTGRTRTGVGVYARALQQALTDRALEVRPWQLPLGDDGSRGRRLRNGVRLANWFARGIRSRAQRERIDVVHTTTSVGPLACGCPVVMTVHDATPLTMPVNRGLGDRAFTRLFSVEAARRAAAIIAPTRHAADAIAEHYRIPRSRIHVTPLGVAPHFRTPATEAVTAVKRRLGLDRPYVLFVGAGTRRKNLPRLVAAVGLVARTLPDVVLVIAGPVGRNDESSVTAIPRGVALPDVRRLGEVDDADLPAIYAGAACLGYVSEYEGFGLPIVEAMSAGTPVVTSNTSSMPEVAGDAALLVDPWSVESIADGLQRVLCDSTLSEILRLRGLARSLQFDWARTATATEQVYREACGLDYSSRVALSPGPDSAPAHSPAALAQ